MNDYFILGILAVAIFIIVFKISQPIITILLYAISEYMAGHKKK